MDNKKKKFNTNRVAAYALSGVMLASVVPYNVFANTSEINNALEIAAEKTPGAQRAGEDKVGLTEDQKAHAGKSANNWEETIGEDNDYWKAPKGYNKAKNLGGLNNGGMGAFEVNYLGTYTDEKGRDIIRLEWKGDSRTAESVWMNQLSLAFKFQKDLFEKIDWDRSYVYSTNKGEQKFLFNNVNAADYQAEFMLSQVTGDYTGNIYELPMNLVLKEGIKISDLGKKDFLVQHRGYDTKYKEVLANFPGTVGTRELNDVDYGQFTRSTVIPLNSNLKSTVIPPNSNKESNRLSFGSSEYDSENKVVKTKHYYRKSDSIDSYLGNVGFKQSFDARLLDLLKEDDQGNVAYLDVRGIDDEKAYSDTPKVGIKRNQINVKDGVATIYVVGSDFESNLDKTGNKVVRATSGNIKTGIFSTLFKTATINYVNTTIEYNVDEDMISKLFPQNKYLQSYAFESGFIHENKNGFLRSEQEVKNETVINKGSKLTLEFKDQMKDKGNQYVMQIGDTYHLMNDKSAPSRANDFETISERNAGSLTNKNYKYDIDMKASRKLSAGEKIRLWIINDNGHKYQSQSWRLYINNGDATKDVDIVNVEGENFTRDYNPYYFQHSKSVDGVMVTKHKYVAQVEEIFDTDTEIKGTVRRDENNVTGYYMTPDGSKFYFNLVKSENSDKARAIVLDENGREAEKGDRNFDKVYNYALGQFKSEDGKETLKLKKDMPIYINNAREGQFPSDPVIERVKSRVTFDQNYEGKPEDTVVVAPENEQYLGSAGYTPNGLDYNGKNVMPENPTREGYIFKGWATKADAKEADFTKDTAITESLKVYAVWVSEDEAKEADKYTPAYKEVNGKVGEEATVAAPTFTDKDGKPATPENVTYELGEGAPEGAKVNADGSVTYTPVDGDAGKTVEVPVVVKYSDGTTDEVKASIKVAEKAKTDAEKNPAVEPDKTEVKDKTKLTPDEKTEVENKVKEKNPEAKKVEVGDDGSVTITYPDDSTNTLTPDQTVTEKAKTDAEKNPAVEPDKTEVKDKTKLTPDEKTEVENKVKEKNPEAKKVEVGDDGSVTITYPDDSTNTLTPDQTVTEKAKTVVDKAPLQNEVNKEDKTKDSDKYKNADKDKKNAYDKALEDAKKVLEDPNATQEEVNKAKKALEEAEKALNGKTSDDDNTGANDGYRPGHGGRDVFDRLFRRHDYTPTYPVKTVVPEKTEYGTPVRDTLWYVFRINDFEYDVVRNGVVTKRKMDVTPVLQNDRTMLPLRYVAEALQADVTWDAKTRTATFTKDGLTASIQIDSDEIVLSNGKTVKMDSKPLNINDRILVSVTNVANVFGLTNGNTQDNTDQDIEWEQQDKSATIYIRR